MNADLRKSNLWDVDLREAVLSNANLEGADLKRGRLSKAKLSGAEISRDTNLENVDWGPNYILGDEDCKDFEGAANVYRVLKQWYTNAGRYDIAGRSHFREWEARRKSGRESIRDTFKGRGLCSVLDRDWWKGVLNWLWLTILFGGLCGYGEKPLNVVVAAAIVLFSMAGIYSTSELTVPSSLYYSAVSFVALGYGGWVTITENWVKALGAVEAFIGVFMMALFLVTFTRKMTR